MTGFDEFMKVFGNVTLSTVVTCAVAITFLVLAYRKFRDYLVKRYQSEEKKNQQLAEALEAIRKYPEYRQLSMKIQGKLETEIQELRVAQQELRAAQEESNARLIRMEEESTKRDRNKLRDILIQHYRYYTSQDHNPAQAWTRMESEAFWELFGDYEAVNGDGYVHSEVQPAMNKLTVVEVNDLDAIATLMHSRK